MFVNCKENDDLKKSINQAFTIGTKLVSLYEPNRKSLDGKISLEMVYYS